MTSRCSSESTRRSCTACVNCGATGAITGVGNVLPAPVLELFRLARRAAEGDPVAHRSAVELERALLPLSTFDEGPDLVLYYKHLAVLTGHHEFEHSVHGDDALSPSQAAFACAQLERFEAWWRRRHGHVTVLTATTRATATATVSGSGRDR